jgi:hypothetical protein
VLLVGVDASPAAAQPFYPPLEVGGHVSVLHLSEFDAPGAALGVDFARSVGHGLALDGSLTAFLGDRQLRPTLLFWDRWRILGLIGARAGRAWGRLEGSAHARAGFLRFTSGDSVVCTATFPTPLDCRLAAGYTAFAADVGGGVSVALNGSGRRRLRIEVSDLLVRYGVEATRPGGEVTDGFTSHNLLVNVGMAWRF